MFDIGWLSNHLFGVNTIGNSISMFNGEDEQ